ncbi:Mss4-like protein [Coprinopsis sp. MPI-PUGE-AT-0042]|nr:Mss4-like protein [Coprinopsis sp. MPI-PUGE-AT-0042]
MSTTDVTISGGCFCRAARYELKGKPFRSSYCHCTLCQRLSASPFVWTTHWEADQFKWTHSESPEDQLQSYSVANKPWKKCYRCKDCGSQIVSYNSKTGRWSTWGAQFDRDDNAKIKNWDVVKPNAHIFYETRVLDIEDGLGKWAGYADESQKLG